jgi:hypothetical protein
MKNSYKIELRHGWPVDVLFYRKKESKAPHLGWVMKVTCNVDCAKTGEKDYFGQETSVDYYSKKITSRKVANLAKAELLAMFEHQIEESLFIDGKRAFPDPHRKRARKKKR